MNGPPAEEHGSASVLLVAVIAVVTALSFAALSLAEVRISRHRAAAAADLAAIAGAAAWPASPHAMCARAREVARLNGAVVTDCHLTGRAVAIRLTVKAGGALPRGTVVSARSRAVRDMVGSSGRTGQRRGRDSRWPLPKVAYSHGSPHSQASLLTAMAAPEARPSLKGGRRSVQVVDCRGAGFDIGPGDRGFGRVSDRRVVGVVAVPGDVALRREVLTLDEGRRILDGAVND